MITLTTDFGLKDSYVAQMKGVIRSINPDVEIVDITHQVPPQDVRGASYILDSVIDSFPKKTIHVIVVDPGVGSDREIIAAEINSQYWISPDNGLLTFPAKRFTPKKIITLTNDDYWQQNISSTFHGRDIMAPVAAHLGLGVPLSSLGEKINTEPILLDQNSPSITENEIHGEVIWIDHFGNLITDITPDEFKNSFTDSSVITVNNVKINRISKYFSEKKIGEPLAYIGSSGRLEIAIRNGNAAENMNIKPGQKVILQNKELGNN